MKNFGTFRTIFKNKKDNYLFDTLQVWVRSFEEIEELLLRGMERCKWNFRNLGFVKGIEENFHVMNKFNFYLVNDIVHLNYFM